MSSADLGRELAKVQREIRAERTRAADAAKQSKGRIAKLEQRAANLEALIMGEVGAQAEIPTEGGEG